VNFEAAVRGLIAGDYSRLEPLFQRGAEGQVPVIEWHRGGRFAAQPEALAEAFTCACFLAADEAVDYLLAQGVSPDGGKLTGMTAFHWAANRGQLGIVRKLIRAGASLENKNRFGGTVLSCTVWSLINEPRPRHLEIIDVLLADGANAGELPHETGNKDADQRLRRHRGL
jgi:hypothetical protein